MPSNDTLCKQLRLLPWTPPHAARRKEPSSASSLTLPKVTARWEDMENVVFQDHLCLLFHLWFFSFFPLLHQCQSLKIKSESYILISKVNHYIIWSKMLGDLMSTDMYFYKQKWISEYFKSSWNFCSKTSVKHNSFLVTDRINYFDLQIIRNAVTNIPTIWWNSQKFLKVTRPHLASSKKSCRFPSCSHIGRTVPREAFYLLAIRNYLED